MIKLFSKDNCEKCDEIKKFMKDRNIEFQELPLSSEENLSYLVCNDVSISEAPVIEKEGVFYTNKTSGLTRALIGK
jgi:glutaredoxin